MVQTASEGRHTKRKKDWLSSPIELRHPRVEYRVRVCKCDPHARTQAFLQVALFIHDLRRPRSLVIPSFYKRVLAGLSLSFFMFLGSLHSLRFLQPLHMPIGLSPHASKAPRALETRESATVLDSFSSLTRPLWPLLSQQSSPRFFCLFRSSRPRPTPPPTRGGQKAGHTGLPPTSCCSPNAMAFSLFLLPQRLLHRSDA